MTQQDTEALQELSKVLWGTHIWQVRLNIQHRFEEGYSAEDLDQLCLDFHEPLPVPEKAGRHRRIGSLWINACNTGARLEQEGKTLVASNDSVVKVLDQFPKMVGCRLLSAVVRPPGGDTAFIFENDLTLNCFPARSQGGDSWTIWTQDGNQLKL